MAVVVSPLYLFAKEPAVLSGISLCGVHGAVKGCLSLLLGLGCSLSVLGYLGGIRHVLEQVYLLDLHLAGLFHPAAVGYTGDVSEVALLAGRPSVAFLRTMSALHL